MGKNIKRSRFKELIIDIYNWMLKAYNHQGWWPILDCKGYNPVKKAISEGYHPGDYSYPKNNNQRFEICVGAILTQNTAWTNVKKALINLKSANSLSAKKILQLDTYMLKDLIKPAGYYNQKAAYLTLFADFYLSLKKNIPSREQILECRGIGNETADSILLYAYAQPEFVVDTYTKRIFSQLGFFEEDAKYMDIKKKFESNLAKEVYLYQEFHALIVEHAKRYYNKKPYGRDDPLINIVG